MKRKIMVIGIAITILLGIGLLTGCDNRSDQYAIHRAKIDIVEGAINDIKRGVENGNGCPSCTCNEGLLGEIEELRGKLVAIRDELRDAETELLGRIISLKEELDDLWLQLKRNKVRPVNFVSALQHMEPGNLGSIIEAIVTSFDEWEALNFASFTMSLPLAESYSKLIERYKEQFFAEKALIVFTFGVHTGGNSFDEVSLDNIGNALYLEVTIELGILDVMSYGIVILEVSNADILAITTLNITLNQIY